MTHYTASEMKLAYDLSLIKAIFDKKTLIKQELESKIFYAAIERVKTLIERNDNQTKRLYASAEKAIAELAIAQIERKRKHREMLAERELMKAIA